MADVVVCASSITGRFTTAGASHRMASRLEHESTPADLSDDLPCRGQFGNEYQQRSTATEARSLRSQASRRVRYPADEPWHGDCAEFGTKG